MARRGWLFFCLPALLAAGPSASPVQALAGRYGAHFKNGTVDGSTYWSDDVLEIVPVDARHAYFRLELNFFNGHACTLSGVAGARGRALDYVSAGPAWDGRMCRLSLYRSGDKVRMDDHDGSCQASCGWRGGYAGAALPWRSKRPITYMARLKSSTEYREALTAWRGDRGARP